jgi:hypothetical protein
MYNDKQAQITTDQTTWIGMLADDLYALYEDKSSPVSLAFYIHGFDNSAFDARIGHTWYGSRMYANGFQQGLIVGASWPSNCNSAYYARQYATASYGLMSDVLQTIPLVTAALQAKYGNNAPKLNTAVVCHSMGNYLMSTTLASGNVPNYQGAVDWAIMLAPDVDYAIFTQGSSVLNQGNAIYQMANGHVLVFWCINDEVLEADEHIGNWCVLGYRGPKQPISSSTPNVYFLNSVNFATSDDAAHYVPNEYVSTQLVHSVYRFDPQLVAWQAITIASGGLDETLKEAIQAPTPEIPEVSCPPSQDRIDAYISKVTRRRRI